MMILTSEKLFAAAPNVKRLVVDNLQDQTGGMKDENHDDQRGRDTVDEYRGDDYDGDTFDGQNYINYDLPQLCPLSLRLFMLPCFCLSSTWK